ncbi:protein lifeguard 1 isoform X1 [Colletes gigas]|uniref:protein lifeguard 1 isoform X1 n=2 Tax=Colletes gigas TaxID=935657 RepID=UPI001C9A44C3|nr:protein lifeguard 1 isoform X1 [Colletes gigas]XP_043260387.1 protein lifeguard 1 isoform X1 [Colletes gigas]
MTTWQSTPGAGFYPGQQGFPQQNPGYPPQSGYNPEYISPFGAPPPGFIPPPGAPPPGGPPYGPAAPFGAEVQGMYGSNYAEDPMQDEIKGFDFNEKSIRNGFIRKVYSILMCQLLITVSLIALFLYHRPTQLWVMHHPELFWIAFVATIVLIICIACCTSVRRKAPMNFIFLFLFTIAEGFLLATAASTFKSEEVLLAVGITAAVCLSLTLFAFQTKIDFTGLNSVLFVALVIFVLFGIIASFWHGKIITIVYSSIGALLFSIYLIYDTQMIMGGNKKYSISPEEYIFAALTLYIDIVQIFIDILMLIGVSRN